MLSLQTWMNLWILACWSSAWLLRKWASQSSSTGLIPETHTATLESSTRACTFSRYSLVITLFTCLLFNLARKLKWKTFIKHAQRRYTTQFRMLKRKQESRMTRTWPSRPKTLSCSPRRCSRERQTLSKKVHWGGSSKTTSRWVSNLKSSNQNWHTVCNTEISADSPLF